MKNSLSIAAQGKTERTVNFNFYQRICVRNVIGLQTAMSLGAIMERKVTEDEINALYSVRRKVGEDIDDQLQSFVVRFGGEQRIDEGRVRAAGELNSVSAVLDGMERRVFHAFMEGWIRTQATLADRDWAMSVIEQCK